MKYNFQLSKLAIQDLEYIFKFTLEFWSLSQAEEYHKLINLEFKSICQNPLSGKSIDEIKDNHRCKIIKSHYIIYKEIDQTIYIDRILHQRMDIVEILNDK